MIDTTIAFQWFATLAWFLLPCAGPYTMPTFYEDELREWKGKSKSAEAGASEETRTFRDIVASPAAWVFTPIWWVVNAAFGAVAVLYWQNPSITHPDRADVVFAMMLAVPPLELLWSFLFFRPYSFVGAAVVAWILLADVAVQWAFIVWSGNTMTAIMIILVIPSIWCLIAAPWSSVVASRVPIKELVEIVEQKRVALETLIRMQMNGKFASLASKMMPTMGSSTLRQRQVAEGIPSHAWGGE